MLAEYFARSGAFMLAEYFARLGAVLYVTLQDASRVLC